MVAVHIADDVAAVLALYDGLVEPACRAPSLVDQLEALAGRLLEGHAARHPGARVELTNWKPDLTGASPEEVFGHRLSDRAARETVARSHGFADWKAAFAVGHRRPHASFERAIEALLAGDTGTLAGMIAGEPDLVEKRSHHGHGATLLHYVAANGVETYRQRVPDNAVEVVRLLIGSGADPAARARFYGAGRSTRDLAVTSAHTAAAGVLDGIVAALENFRPDGAQ